MSGEILGSYISYFVHLNIWSQAVHERRAAPGSHTVTPLLQWPLQHALYGHRTRGSYPYT